ncbi:MAG: TetR/AcrR family transcriptional regulator [Chitinophagaceae bacterium]
MRNLIMNTAFEMFLKEGYIGTSLRLIAKKIEYSPGTIYLYYKDKDELFFDIQTRCFQNLIAQYENTEKLADPLERLKQIGTIYMDYNSRSPQCFNLMFMLDGPLSELKKRDRWGKYGNVAGFFKYTVMECIDNGLISYSDPDEACLEIWALAHGLTTIYVKKSYEVMGLTESDIKKYMNSSWRSFINRIII